jgi:hypothetical protein
MHSIVAENMDIQRPYPLLGGGMRTRMITIRHRTDALMREISLMK